MTWCFVWHFRIIPKTGWRRGARKITPRPVQHLQSVANYGLVYRWSIENYIVRLQCCRVILTVAQYMNFFNCGKTEVRWDIVNLFKSNINISFLNMSSFDNLISMDMKLTMTKCENSKLSISGFLKRHNEILQPSSVSFGKGIKSLKQK